MVLFSCSEVNKVAFRLFCVVDLFVGCLFRVLCVVLGVLCGFDYGLWVV